MAENTNNNKAYGEGYEEDVWAHDETTRRYGLGALLIVFVLLCAFTLFVFGAKYGGTLACSNSGLTKIGSTLNPRCLLINMTPTQSCFDKNGEVRVLQGVYSLEKYKGGCIEPVCTSMAEGELNCKVATCGNKDVVVVVTQ